MHIRCQKHGTRMITAIENGKIKKERVSRKPISAEDLVKAANSWSCSEIP